MLITLAFVSTGNTHFHIDTHKRILFYLFVHSLTFHFNPVALMSIKVWIIMYLAVKYETDRHSTLFDFKVKGCEWARAKHTPF